MTAPVQTAKLLLGPGPSPVSPRIMRALSRPILSHLDPDLMLLMDEIRARLRDVFRAGDGSLSLAISGTGTSGMDAAIDNLVAPGCRATAVVNGYFGDRLAQMLVRRGAVVSRVEGEWGRAIDPAALEAALRTTPAQVVTLVHAETSTGVLNPAADLCRAAADAGAMTIVDAVTSLGAHPVDAEAWGADVVYSCTQKGLGAPSGLAPITFSARARAARAANAPFYFDVALLDDYWVNRKYHHTISAPLIYALHEALGEVVEEGLDRRWARHHENHDRFVAGLNEMGLTLLPPPGERLWSLNTVRVPEGVDEAVVRKRLLAEYAIEIGAGLGPFAGKIWRIGLMGSGSSTENVARLLDALRTILA